MGARDMMREFLFHPSLHIPSLSLRPWAKCPMPHAWEGRICVPFDSGPCCVDQSRHWFGSVPAIKDCGGGAKEGLDVQALCPAVICKSAWTIGTYASGLRRWSSPRSSLKQAHDSQRGFRCYPFSKMKRGQQAMISLCLDHWWPGVILLRGCHAHARLFPSQEDHHLAARVILQAAQDSSHHYSWLHLVLMSQRP